MKKILLLLLILPLTAVNAEDGNSILKEMDRRMNPNSYESYRKLINIEPNGNKKEYVLYTAKKDRDKVAALFLLPASDKGRSTLRLAENMWLYIPNVGKPVRITSLQSVTGGVFNNADILAIDYSEEYTVVKVDADASSYILSCKAKDKTVAYDKLKIWVDKARKLPVKIECLTNREMLIKTLHFKNVKDYGGGIVRPSVIETDSPLYKNYKSIMIFNGIKSKNFKNEVFTLTFMPNISSIR